MKCIEDTFPSTCYCKTFEFFIDLLNVDKKYTMLQGKYRYTKDIYGVEVFETQGRNPPFPTAFLYNWNECTLPRFVFDWNVHHNGFHVLEKPASA